MHRREQLKGSQNILIVDHTSSFNLVLLCLLYYLIGTNGSSMNFRSLTSSSLELQVTFQAGAAGQQLGAGLTSHPGAPALQ